MGNCQAVDAAALVIQHPSGRIDRMYWPMTASDVMKMNPGHYVTLIIPLPAAPGDNSDDKTVRFTRVKLLRSTETLVLGRAYRLVTSQEVMKVLRAKRNAKSKNKPEKLPRDLDKNTSTSNTEDVAGISQLDETSQAVGAHERLGQRQGSSNIAVARSKSWRPSLQSISEAGS